MKRGGLALYWSAILVAFFVLGYFILANAQMLIGDEIMYVRHVCSGIPFEIGDMNIPEDGRFCPFGHTLYNLVLLLTPERSYISAYYIYVVHLLLFALFLIATAVMYKSFTDKGKAGSLIALLGVLAISFRVYPYYLQCGSCVSVNLTAYSLFILLSYELIGVNSNKNQLLYLIATLIIGNFFIYCSENNFVIPFSMGVCILLFYGKPLSQFKKTFAWSLILSSIVFLVLYSVLIIPNINNAYDPTHGIKINKITNALKMIWAQKVLVLSVPLSIIRLVFILRKKTLASFFDLLLFTSDAILLSNCILGLNYTLYYTSSVVFALPAVIYYSCDYLGRKVALLVCATLFSLYSYHLPEKISDSQKGRIETKQDIHTLHCYYKKGETIYWYNPSLENAEDKEAIGKRELQIISLTGLIRWEMRDSTFYMKRVKSFSDSMKGVWLNSIHNERYCKTDTLTMINYPIIFTSGEINGYLVQ